MLKREIHSLNNKIRNLGDKREIVVRERQLLQERIETLVGSITNEVDSRRRLRKEIKEMNEAFKIEIQEMAAEQRTAEELEECYFSDDEDLVVNTHKRENIDSEDWDEMNGVMEGVEDDQNEDNVEEILKLAEEDDEDEQDPGAELFNPERLAEEEDEVDISEIGDDDFEPTRCALNQRVEHRHEQVQLMRKSNFMLKAKIDRLYDVLQMQKEKHHDLRQELTRMLADIQ